MCWDGWTAMNKEEQMCIALTWLDTRTFDFKGMRMGAPFVDGDTVAENIFTAVDEFMKTNWDIIWSKVYSSTQDNANVAAAARQDLLHAIACFMHTIELVLKDAEKETPGASAAFASQRAIASFIHKSVLVAGYGLMFVCSLLI